MSTFRTAALAVAALSSLVGASVGQAAVRPEIASMRAAPVATESVARAGVRQQGPSNLLGSGLVIPVVVGVFVVVTLTVVIAGGSSSPR